MGRPQLLSSRTVFKRLSQIVYLIAHPFSHFHCAKIIRESGLADDPLISFRYLGDQLALSLRTPQRRDALAGHYEALPELLQPAVGHNLPHGVRVWRKDLPGGDPPLSIVLEPSRLAPMEGELQLRFSFKTDLYVLTFLIAPGRAFGLDLNRVLFIGGVQGRVGAREEMREASRHNSEISPTAMLIVTVQAIARLTRVDGLIGIGDDDHISMAYSPSKIMFDYRRFWTEVGGRRLGSHYSLPFESPQKPLSEIPLTHRRRARLRREAKRAVTEDIEYRLRQILRPPVGSIEPHRVTNPMHKRVFA